MSKVKVVRTRYLKIKRGITWKAFTGNRRMILKSVVGMINDAICAQWMILHAFLKSETLVSILKAIAWDLIDLNRWQTSMNQ